MGFSCFGPLFQAFDPGRAKMVIFGLRASKSLFLTQKSSFFGLILQKLRVKNSFWSILKHFSGKNWSKMTIFRFFTLFCMDFCPKMTPKTPENIRFFTISLPKSCRQPLVSLMVTFFSIFGSFLWTFGAMKGSKLRQNRHFWILKSSIFDKWSRK